MRNPLSTNRRPWWGAGFVALILLTACSSSASRGGTTASTTSASSQPSVGAGSTASPSGAAGTSVAAGSSPATAHPLALLQAALAALTTTYHFVSTVTVDGAPVLVAEGDRVGDSSRLTLTRDNAVVSYVIMPDGSWTMPEGSTWQKLDADPANADPINALKVPTAVQLTSGDATTANLSVVVPQAALGIPGDGKVTLIVTVARGALETITYSTTATGKPATVKAVFGPAHDASPVVAPA